MKAEGCSDPDLRGLPDGRVGSSPVRGGVDKVVGGNRHPIGGRQQAISEPKQVGQGRGAAGTGAKGGTLIFVLMRLAGLWNLGRYDYNRRLLGRHGQAFIRTGPQRKANQIERQYVRDPLQDCKGTAEIRATGSQKGLLT